MFSLPGTVSTTIRMTVVTVFVVATLFTATVAIGLQYYFAQSMARNAAADLYTTTAHGIAAELQGISNVTGNIIALLSGNPALPDPEREAAQLKIFTAVLKKNPLFYGIYIGRDDGSFFEVVNLQASQTARRKLAALTTDRWLVITLREGPNGRQRHFQYLDQALQARTSRTEPTGFEVRERPWFKAAYSSGEVEVSDPYLFAQLGVTGRTVSARVTGSNTVVGIDMTLESLSKFLSLQKVSANSELYLYNLTGMVIASNGNHGKATSATVPTELLIETANNPADHGRLMSTELHGKDHVLYSAPTAALSGSKSPLFIGILTPVDTVMAPFLSKVKLSILITSAFLLLLLPASWLFANPIVRPVIQLAHENEKVRRREFDLVQRVPSSVRELDELSESMVAMVDSIQTYEQSQRDLMDSFIKLIAEAIDEKSPYTGGHCERVPELALMLAEHASNSDAPAFRDFQLETDEQWREYRIAAWLHDCGKITTPEHIVDKGSKLETIYNRIHEVRMRFEVLWRDAEVYYLEQLLENPLRREELQAELEQRRQELQSDFKFVAGCNVGGEFLDEDKQTRLRAIAGKTWQRNFDDRVGLSPVEELRESGEPCPLPATEQLLADKPKHIIKRVHPTDYAPELGINMDVPEHLFNQGELYNLSISRGTLTEEDRFKINEHMISTIRMLDRLPFPDELKNVPRYASTHHETMKGSGYPRRLSGDQLSIPERILAVADVFEALTASDRPYKKAKPVSVAVAILHTMVEENHLDRDCFELFLKEKVYLDYAEQYLGVEQIDEVDIGRYVQVS